MEVCLYCQIVHVQIRMCTRKWDPKDSLWFWDTKRSCIPDQKTRHCADFDFQADYRMKIKEKEKPDKYLDLARELNKLWRMNLTVIQIVGALRIAPPPKKKTEKRFVKLKFQRRSTRNRLHHYTRKISKNISKSLGELRRLPIIQTSVKKQQL